MNTSLSNDRTLVLTKQEVNIGRRFDSVRRRKKNDSVGGRKMDKKKIEDVLKALEGISYLEWVKIKMGIDEYYRVVSAKKTNEIQIADPNTIMPFIKSRCM